MKIINAGLFCVALCAAATPAHAQMTWTDKGFVNANVGFQAGSQDFAATTPFDIYGETGSVASTMETKVGGFFDIAAGYKVWRNLALGLGYSIGTGSSDAVVNASVPDPLVFDAFRSVSSNVSDVTHREQAFHITGTWMIPVTDKVDVGIAFGPTIFNVNQDVPNGVDVTEPGPSITRVNVDDVGETAVGFHLGVDVTYLLTPRIGVGGLARYTRGSTEIGGNDLDLGGFQIGAGLRVRF